MKATEYDVAVIGGGIAGLAIAEVFARSGRGVILIEQNTQLCQEASATQHGWFHFGSLYSIFPQNQFLRTMIGGLEDLLEYYPAFPGFNITISDDGHILFGTDQLSWFRNEPIEYIVCARNDPDFDMQSFDGFRSYAEKLFFLLTWEMAIKQFISRHQRFHKHNWCGHVAASQWIPRAGWADYSREVITKPDHVDINLDRDTHFRVLGYDRPMRATAIMTDLVRSLVGSGGELALEVEVERLEKSGAGTRLHTTTGRTIHATNVVIAAGRWLRRFAGLSDIVRVVASPLLVAYPALTTRNFVRMTPFVERSINHLHHQVEESTYSLVGGGYFADPNDPTAISRANKCLLAMARNVFPKLGKARVLEEYLGYKTEIVPRSGERNYQYILRQVDDGVYAAVPGKFSLCFSLAINSFKKLTGEEPSKEVRLASHDLAHGIVGQTKHATLISRALKTNGRVLADS